MAVVLDTLEYARRLRECGFTEQQADGQARALAAAMSDALATRQDLRELEARIDGRFALVDARIDGLEKHIDTRFAEQEQCTEIRLAEQEQRMEIRLAEQEQRMEIRLAEQETRLTGRLAEQDAHFGGELADLERRMTVRLGGIMVTGIGVVSALVRLL